jgi:uncharacterized surface protein with fasciclin (FAS1) repeats
MKNPILKLRMNILLLAFLAMSAVAFTSCNDDDDDGEISPETITDIVVKDDDFSLLEAAVIRADLQEVLAEGSLTVFAPDNDAFAAAGFPDVASIEATPVATLQDLLQYHVLPTTVGANQIPSGDNNDRLTIDNETLYISNNANGITVNGVDVTRADIDADNGVIHVIDAVLFPPNGDIVTVAQDNDDLSFLVAAVVRADLVNTLSTTEPLTVFAPTNAAFQAAGFPDIASIQNADVETLTDILTYHVVEARAYSGNLTDDSNVMTLAGGTVRIDTDGTITVTGDGNATASNVVGANITTTNGVVHVIDRVLLPQQ